MSELLCIARLKIHHGKLDEFKHLAARCVELVRTKDTRTLHLQLNRLVSGGRRRRVDDVLVRLDLGLRTLDPRSVHLHDNARTCVAFRRCLIDRGTVACINPTLFASFDLNQIISSLLVRCALELQRRRSNGDGCDARVARKNV
jgi:hypothetical protein